MKGIAALYIGAALVAVATAKELSPLPAFAPMPHLDAVERYRGDGISAIEISVRDSAGNLCPSARAEVALAWKGHSEGGAFLDPATNVVRLAGGRARALVRRPPQTDRSVTRLSFKPVAADIIPTSIVLADFDDVKAVWVRRPEGGVPYEVPASSVTNDFKATIRCDRPFHLYSDANKPMAFNAVFRNLTAVSRKVKTLCRVRDWDGKVVVEKAVEAEVAADKVLVRRVEFNPSEPRGLYFVEASALDAASGRELAFSRTTLARLPPHEFIQDAEHSIFGLSHCADNFWGHEAMQRLMDRLGVRWLRTGDGRVQHPGRSVNYHNSLNWRSCLWSETERDSFVRGQFAYLSERGGTRFEWGNEVNLINAVAAAGDGIGKCQFAREYISWVKSFRRVMDEQGYSGKYELLGMGMAGFDHAFATRMREEGVLPLLDGFCLHPAGSQHVPDFPYGVAGCPPPERSLGPHPGDYPTLNSHWNFLGALRAARDFIDKYAPDMPLWITEMYAGCEPNHPWNGSVRDGADTVLLEYALAVAERVRVAMFWVMNGGIVSDPYGVKPGNREYTFGLLSRDTSLKPSAMGYATAAEALEGAVFKGWMKLDDPKSHGLLFDTPRGPAAVMWGRWDGHWLTFKDADGIVRHREPWLDRWPTKKAIRLPATSGGNVVRVDSIGRRRSVASKDGWTDVVLDGSPCIVYGLDMERIKIW